MNSSQIKNPRSRKNWRRGAVTLALFAFVSFSVLSVAAQLGSQKRITSVWTSTTAEGSRVHVVSDSPVNDYEGYTRGGRFYVKIPLADLPSARGSLLGRGFDDVQIQRYGDGIIISFRLQPGTNAHVEQASNRLEIVFTIPAGLRSAVAGVRDTDDANRTRARRITDAAGPSPSSSSPSSGAGSERRQSGQRRVPRAVSAVRQPANTGSASGTSSSSGLKGVGSRAGQRDRSTGASETATSKQPTAVTSTPSPSPVSSPSPAVSPAASPTVSPAASPTATTSGLSASASPAGTSVSSATPAPSEPSPAITPNNAANSKDNDWRSRVHYWKVWAELNWVPLLVGGLIGLALLVLLFFWRGAKRVREYDEREQTEAASDTPVPRDSAPPTAASEAAATAGTPTGATGAGPSQAAGQTHSSNAAPSETEKHEGEEPEREVFEL